MTTFAAKSAIDGGAGTRNRSPFAWLDLILLVLALPVFILAGFNLVGYAIAAAVWLVQRGVQVWAEAKARRELAAGDRKRAMGIIGVTSLARPWLMAATVLIAGIVAREPGVQAAILLAVLFTANLAVRAVTQLLSSDPEAGRS